MENADRNTLAGRCFLVAFYAVYAAFVVLLVGTALSIPAHGQSSDSGTKYEFAIVGSGSLHVDYEIKPSDVLAWTDEGLAWTPGVMEVIYEDSAGTYGWALSSPIVRCKQGYFRGPLGDCIKRTCENGGLGEEDCKQDPPPVECPEGTTRVGDSCLLPVECPEGTELAADGASCELPVGDPPPVECEDPSHVLVGDVCIPPVEEPEPVDPEDATDLRCFPACELQESDWLRRRFRVTGTITRQDGTVEPLEFTNQPPHGNLQTTAFAARGTCDNVVGVIRVRNGCARNGHWWVDWSSNDVGPRVDLWIEDRSGGTVQHYFKDEADTLKTVLDTEAFACR